MTHAVAATGAGLGAGALQIMRKAALKPAQDSVYKIRYAT